MNLVEDLFAFIGPRPVAVQEMGRSRVLLLSAFAVLSSLVLAAFWGVAAGSSLRHLALGNALTVPVLLLVSSAAALPAGVVVFRLTVPDARGSHLVLGHAGAMFGAALVLALLAPLVALFQYSSAWAGPRVALGSAVVGVIVGSLLFARGMKKLWPDPGARRKMAAPAILLCVLQTAALLQLAAVSPHVMPQRTALGRGIDALAPMGSTP
jgi:hypothetical protein